MVVEQINPSQYVVTLDQNEDNKNNEDQSNPQINVQKFYDNLIKYYMEDIKRLKFELRKVNNQNIKVNDYQIDIVKFNNTESN